MKKNVKSIMVDNNHLKKVRVFSVKTNIQSRLDRIKPFVLLRHEKNNIAELSVLFVLVLRANKGKEMNA